LQVQTAKGNVNVVGDKIIVSNADEATIYLTAATNYKNYRDVTANPVAICKTAFQNLKGKTYDQVKSSHIKEYGQYFNTFSIKFGDDKNNRGQKPLLRR
jgi:alpha-L-fucosidase 2